MGGKAIEATSGFFAKLCHQVNNVVSFGVEKRNRSLSCSSVSIFCVSCCHWVLLAHRVAGIVVSVESCHNEVAMGKLFSQCWYRVGIVASESIVRGSFSRVVN